LFSALHDLYKTQLPNGQLGWGFCRGMVSACRPVFDDCDNNHHVVKVLLATNILVPGNLWNETVLEATQLLFTTLPQARDFLDRLNAFIDDKDEGKVVHLGKKDIDLSEVVQSMGLRPHGEYAVTSHLTDENDEKNLKRVAFKFAVSQGATAHLWVEDKEGKEVLTVALDFFGEKLRALVWSPGDQGKDPTHAVELCPGEMEAIEVVEVKT